MSLLGFGPLDWVLISIVIVSMVVGIIRGFVREGLSILVWVLSFWLAFKFANGFDERILSTYIAHDTIRYGIAFAGIFIVTLIVGSFVNYLIATAVQRTGLGGTDRLLGVVFGFLRGALIIVVLLFFAKLTPITERDWFKASKVLPQFEWAENWIHGLLPDNIAEHLNIDFKEKREEMIQKTLEDTLGNGDIQILPERNEDTQAVQIDDNEGEITLEWVEP